ncbi:MAG: glycosyltransferase family 4 protein [Anaerolineae bacterium]|nr:glycosyltransferase family 4 protein [Anaerolineae bacterium]MCZ7551577.1 glycosyltransferase family 4 protein [Anaerolineales bacterium]
MRILTALTYYRPHYSGLTIYAEREARALVERGHQVTVLTSRFSPQLPAREVCDGVQVVRPRVWFRVSKGVIMPGFLPQAWKLMHQADVVQLHVPQFDAAPISLLARLLAKPVVLTYHCDLKLPKGWLHATANRVSDLANLISAAAADVIVTNTRDYAENSPVMRHFLPKVWQIYPPVELAPITEQDLDAFRRRFEIRPGQRIIGMAARLATEKGVEYLVQALPAVLKRFPEARVLFVGPYQDLIGEEAYRARIMPTIESLGAHWSFLGIVSPQEMAAFFHLSEVLVLPSLNSTESYGLVQVEALTCHTPVIASDLPGVRVPVQITGSGLVAPPADARSLAEALIEILQEPARYRGKPEALVKLSKPQAVAEQYERVFELVQDRTRLQQALKRHDLQTHSPHE